MIIWKIIGVLLIFLFQLSKSQISPIEEIILTSQPASVSFTSPDAMLRLQPWNFAKYSTIEIQFHTREPRGILFFVGSSSSSSDCIGLEIFNSDLYGFGKMLNKDFRIQLNQNEIMVSNGKFFKVSIQILATNLLVFKFDDVEINEKIPTPGRLEFDSYTYIGGVDTITRLPWKAFSQTGFTGCISYIRVNEEKFIDTKQHSKQTEMQGAKTGTCQTSVARCLPEICGPGKCYERSYNVLDQTKNFYCDCSGTFKSYSYSAVDILRGEACLVDSQKFQCNTKSYLRYNFDKEKTTHFDDISIDFQTSNMKEPLFLMKSGIGNEINTFLSAEVIAGQMIIVIKLYESNNKKYKSSFYSRKTNLNDGEWHTLKLSRYAYKIEFYVDDRESKIKGELYQTSIEEKFFNRVKEILLGSNTRPPGSDKCTGEIKNFFWNEDDLLGKKNRYGYYSSQLITDKPNLPILPPFPRQPPMPCTIKPNHVYTILNNIPLTKEGLMIFIEFKTKFDGIIWHAVNVFSSQDWITLLVNSNSIMITYSLPPNEGVHIIELTRGGILIKDNTWHRVIININKPKEIIYIHIDDVESLTNEIKLKYSKNTLTEINFISLSLGGISDNSQYLQFYNVLRNKNPEIAQNFAGPDEFKFVGCLGDILSINGNYSGNLIQKPDITSYPKESLFCRACQEDVKKCPKNYCQNKGRCYNINENKISCDCKKTQFYGEFCDIKRPSCDPNPCKNGVCQIVRNNRICNCTGTGFTGFDCEISRCSNHICQNNGKCIIKQGIPECDCSKSAYEGQNCEIPKCPLDFCQNSGRCLLNSDNQLPYCVCNGTGFYGYRCNKPICPPNYCSINGNCIVRDDSAICYCNEGFTGEKCEKAICSKDKCVNGRCLVVNNLPFCICSKDFQGKNCEKPKPCPTGYCLYGGQCLMSNGMPKCNCSQTNYMGKKCEKPKKCPEKYCDNGGTCTIIANNFVCNCSNISYTGEKCSNKIGCPNNYCKNGGACEIKNSKFSCNCSLTAYGGEQCDQKVNGVLCDYKEPGYAITAFKPPLVSSGIMTSMGFQTFVKTGTLFCYETADDKYWLIKLVDGRLVVDINGITFNMKTVVNDGQYHFLKVFRDEINFVITLDHYPYEILMIPTTITSILTLPNNIIIYTKLTLCNSCPDTFNRDRFQGAIGNARSGHIDISNSLKNGGGIMIGGIQSSLTPFTPLQEIPAIQSCFANFCKNGAKCIVRNYGPKCDCGLSGFTGNKCDQKIMIIRSVPPSPGYVVITRNPTMATNFDLIRFISESSESSTPLTTFITPEGNYLELKIENQQVFARVNGESKGPLSGKLIEKNVPNFFKVINLLGRITVYVNGTKLGHVVLKEPVIMKNGSIQISKVLVGANKNMDETIKGYLGDFRHNELSLIAPNGTFDPQARQIPNIKVDQWKISSRSMPDIKKVTKGNHGGVVFSLTKFITAEGFGAGAIVSVSNGPTILGAQLMSFGTIGVNPFILGIILAFFLLVMALIWAFMNLMFSRSHVTAGGKKLLLNNNSDFQISPLLQNKSQIQLLSGGLQIGSNGASIQRRAEDTQISINNNIYGGFEQTSFDNYKNGKTEMDVMVSTERQNRMDINKANDLLTNGFNKSTFGTASSVDQERIQPVKYTSVFAQQDPDFQQLNVFSEGEMKIDCCVMSNNSKYAITGSISGPPQVWDLNDGFLTHIMDGSNQACTSLYLAMNNTVLIGLVTQNQQPLTLKLLMMWKFPGGQIIDFGYELLCTTCCVSNDGNSIILADEMKNSSITILNLINQRRQNLIYNKAELMNNDGIQLLKQTKNNQFILAGFRTLDNSTSYMVFDTVMQSKRNGIFTIRANINCTDFINDNEAVTGTENGELIIWDLITFQAVRRILISPNMVDTSESRNPHADSITCVTISNDSSLLATTGLDAKVKVWNMEEEKLLYNLDKHRDEVHSLAWSNDNEILISGSLDGSIRIWNAKIGQEMCYFSSNIEINKVLLSNDKNIVVGIGERAGINKLVMLKILRNTHQVSRNDELESQLL